VKDVAGLLERSDYPELPDPYAGALKEALRFILERFERVAGVMVSGTILRGTPAPSSDLDISVVRLEPRRQRLQRLFEGVPVEIFVNPPAQIRSYFEKERRAGRPITAHMWATGHVLLDPDPVIGELQREARASLALAPDYGAPRVTAERYAAACLYEDACDVVETRPEAAAMIMSVAVHAMLRYAFYATNRYLPREKDLLLALEDLDPHLAHLGRAFYRTPSLQERVALAEEIADRTLGVRGFFEWESLPEELEGAT
jgi:predicted nucleotidyltransferase